MLIESKRTDYFSSVTNHDKAPAFFKTAYEVFQEADRNIGKPAQLFYSIGGYTVKLHFAGNSLVPLITPALEHLSTQQCSSPSLTICLWDSESSKTLIPSPPWSLNDYSARGEVREYTNDYIFTACHKGSGALSILDCSTNTAIWWIRSANNVPFYESGSPLLTILHWWLQKNKRQVVHAGAVGMKQGGVLLAGKGGSGKSTAAIACINSNLFYAGDDYCIIKSSPASYVFSLYNSGKLNTDNVIRFPHLIPAINNYDRTDAEKPLIFLNRHYPLKMIEGFPIKAIFLPRITGLQDTTLTTTTQAIGLKAIAPNTLFQLSHANQSAFFEIAKFIKQVPCYYLNLGTEVKKIPEVILKFLSEN
jgi:hypothetical protein